jgi:hypothetical protein
MARPSGAKDHGHVAPGLERKAVESGDHRDVGGARGLAEHLLDGVRIGWRNAHEFLRQDDDLRAFGGQACDAIRVGVRHGQRFGWIVRFKSSLNALVGRGQPHAHIRLLWRGL